MREPSRSSGVSTKVGLLALAGAGALTAVALTRGPQQGLILVGLAAVATDLATNITPRSATLNGRAQPNGAPITDVHFQYGTSTQYGSTAPAVQNADGSYSAAVTLLPGAKYHFRIVASDSVGAANGNDQILVTPAQAPTVTTQGATGVGGGHATLNGTVDPNGSPINNAYFEYGTTTAYGSIEGMTAPPSKGGTAWAASTGIFMLTGGTRYHYRLVAVNAGGTTYGNDQSFVA